MRLGSWGLNRLLSLELLCLTSPPQYHQPVGLNCSELTNACLETLSLTAQTVPLPPGWWLCGWGEADRRALAFLPQMLNGPAVFGKFHFLNSPILAGPQLHEWKYCQWEMNKTFRLDKTVCKRLKIYNIILDHSLRSPKKPPRCPLNWLFNLKELSKRYAFRIPSRNTRQIILKF